MSRQILFVAPRKDIVIARKEGTGRPQHREDVKALRLISLKVPESLLDAFRGRCRLEGVPYQTQIKRLMSDWLRLATAPDGARIPAISRR